LLLASISRLLRVRYLGREERFVDPKSLSLIRLLVSLALRRRLGLLVGSEIYLIRNLSPRLEIVICFLIV